MPQARIDAFAEATGDHQWIHVDRERAAAGPFGTTIGHGYLTLSLLPAMSYEVVPRQEGGMGINYGLNRVRFPAPVPSGSRVRGTFRVDSIDDFDGGFQATMTATDRARGRRQAGLRGRGRLPLLPLAGPGKPGNPACRLSSATFRIRDQGNSRRSCYEPRNSDPR